MASVLLAVEAATALVGGAVLVGAAVRSAQLLSGPPRSGPAPMLLRLSGFDGGDAGFFRLMGGFVAVVAGALVVVLAVAARGADGDDPLDRALATCVLVAEAALCVAGIAMTIWEWGQPRLLTVVSAVAFPVVVAAAMAAWPRGVDPDADGSGVGYNHGHG